MACLFLVCSLLGGMVTATNPTEPSMQYISYQWVLQLPVIQEDAFFCIGCLLTLAEQFLYLRDTIDKHSPSFAISESGCHQEVL